METGGTSSEMRQQQQEEQVVTQKRLKNVLVALDESDESFFALEWFVDKFLVDLNSTTETATKTPSEQEEISTLTVVHVQHPYVPFIYPPGPVYATPAVMGSMRKSQEESAYAIFNRALQICKEKKIKVETTLLKGDAKEMICQAAEQMNADLLVVGSRGLGQIKRAFLGSVSDYCVHRARCPVLIVRPQKVSNK